MLTLKDNNMNTNVSYIKTHIGLKKTYTTIVTKEEEIDLQGAMITFKNSCGDNVTGVLTQCDTRLFIVLGISEQTNKLSSNRYFNPVTLEEAQDNFISGKWTYLGRANMTARLS